MCFESFWSTQDDWTPIFTVGNVAPTSDQVTVLVTSNQGTYTLPAISLKPLESRTINLRELLATAQPFPVGTNFGGFKVSGASQQSKLMVKEHLISPSAELATPFYGGYQYIVNAYFYENTTDFEDDGDTCCAAPVSTNTGVSVGEQLSGEPDDYQSASPEEGEYGSDNTSIATLSFTGGAGTLTGVAAGSATIWAVVYGIYDSEGDEGDVGTNETEASAYEQIPTHVGFINQVSAMTLTTTTTPACATGSGGYWRRVTLQLFDQNYIPITQSGLTMADSIAIGTPNQLGATNTNTGHENTNGDGQWYDTYSICSSYCPAGTGQTNATQSWTASGAALTGTNALVYKCSSITIDGN